MAYSLVNQLTAEELHDLTCHVIKEVEQTGYNIVRLVADDLAGNEKMFRLLNNGILSCIVSHPVQPLSGSFRPLF